MNLPQLSNASTAVRQERLFILRNSSTLTEVDNATPQQAADIVDTWPAVYMVTVAPDEAALQQTEERFKRESGLRLHAPLHVPADKLNGELQRYDRRASREDSLIALGPRGFNELHVDNRLQTAAALAACGTPLVMLTVFARSRKQMETLENTLCPKMSE